MIQAAGSIALLAVSGVAVTVFPRSILAFLLFQAALLVVYVSRMPDRLRGSLLAVALLVMMPVIGA